MSYVSSRHIARSSHDKLSREQKQPCCEFRAQAIFLSSLYGVLLSGTQLKLFADLGSGQVDLCNVSMQQQELLATWSWGSFRRTAGARGLKPPPADGKAFAESKSRAAWLQEELRLRSTSLQLGKSATSNVSVKVGFVSWACRISLPVVRRTTGNPVIVGRIASGGTLFPNGSTESLLKVQSNTHTRNLNEGPCGPSGCVSHAAGLHLPQKYRRVPRRTGFKVQRYKDHKLHQRPGPGHIPNMTDMHGSTNAAVPSPPRTYYLGTGALKGPFMAYYLGTWGGLGVCLLLWLGECTSRGLLLIL